MILPFSTQFTCPVQDNGFSPSSLLSHCKRDRFEVTSLRYDSFGSVKTASSSKWNVMRSRRNVKAFGLVDKLGKKVWRKKEEDSDSEDEEDEVKEETFGGKEASLDDPVERREWRKTIREVIDKHPDIEEDEEIDMVEKRRKMQKLLADYPLVVNEEDPNWPEDADGWGFSFNQFFNKITIKNEKKEEEDDDEDSEGDDSEKEIVWQDDNYIRPIKDLTTAEWEEAVFKDISPLMVLVHNRYKRPKENEKFREELEKAIQVIWNCGLPSPRCVAVDAVVETDLVSALKVSVFPEIIFTKAGKILYREKGIRTADELSKIMAFFYYGAAKPPCLNGVVNSQEQIPLVDVGVEGSAVGQWWLDAIGNALDERNTFERMGSRQLAGLLISLWVRKSIRTHVGDLDVAAVPCGFGRAIGNKGGVGLRIRVYDRIMCFVNCHLAAHLEAVTRRNADFNHIYRSMVFSKGQSVYTAAAAGASTSAQALKNNPNTNNSTEEEKSHLASADLVAFFGDFNYRLFGITYDEARDFISHRSFDWLREKDQLRQEMNEGKVFQGMREALITFPPTYKFEKNKPGLGGYDSGEKKRIPAWCDRVIYRDNQSISYTECSLKCPVVSSTIMYEACMDVTESDHKPVRCKLHANIAHTDKSVRRQELGKIVKSNEKLRAMFEELKSVPETSVSTNNILLHSQDTFIFTIRNTSNSSRAIFNIVCKGQTLVREDGEEPDNHSRGTFGLPRWLEVSPGAGIIKPDASLQVKVHHEDSHNSEEFIDGIQQNSLSEESSDKEVTLIIIVQGSCSTRTISHSIKVRHCSSAAKSLSLVHSKTTTMTKNLEGSTRYQTDANRGGSTRHRTDDSTRRG